MKNILLLACVLLLAGCASMNPNNYSNPNIGFSINLPPDWKYDEAGSKEIARQANMDGESQGQGIMFTEPKHDPFGHMMFIIVRPSKEVPKSETEIAGHLQSLKEGFGSKASYSRVKNIDGYPALQLLSPQVLYEAHSCFSHRTRIFTGEKMFEISFLISDNLRDRYSALFDNCVESFKIIK